MKKIIFKCITFLLILLVILIILSKIFVPKNNTKEAGLENKYILASGIYLEPENTIDVLVPFILTSRYLERIADRSESIGAKVLLMNKYETE